MIRPWILALLTALCLCSSSALAETRIVVRPFFGPSADLLRRDVVHVLSRHRELELVSTRTVDSTAARLGADANSPEGRIEIAAALQVSAWVEAIIQKRGKELRVTLLFYEGKEHARIARFVATHRKVSELSRMVRSGLWPHSRDALLSAIPPAKSKKRDRHQAVHRSRARTHHKPGGDGSDSPLDEADKAQPKSEEPEEKPSDDAPNEGAPAALAATPASSPGAAGATTIVAARWSVSAGGEGAAGEAPTPELPDALSARVELGSYARVLAYRDPVSSGLGDYTLPAAFQIGAVVRYYPAAHFTAGFASKLGLDLRARLPLAAKLEASDGKSFESDILAYHLGLRTRIPIGQHELALVGGYAVQRFELRDSAAKPAPVPSVEYEFARLGAEAELAVTDKLSLGGNAGFLWLLSAGELGTSAYFPRLSGNGIEAGLLFAYALSDLLDLTLAADLQHYFFDFNVRPGDPIAAGGATDDHMAFSLGLRLSK